MQLTEIVSFKIAELLNNKITPDEPYLKYAAEDNVEVHWSDYLGSKKYKKGELIDDGDYVYGKYFYAPTYAEVLDYLFSEYNTFIEFRLMDSDDKYSYTIIEINKEKQQIIYKYTPQNICQSFETVMETIIKKIIYENEN